MLEAILALAGLVGGFLIALGWYKRGLTELEKDVLDLKKKFDELEHEGHHTRTELELIKQRLGFMEEKIIEMHRIITRPVKIVEHD